MRPEFNVKPTVLVDAVASSAPEDARTASPAPEDAVMASPAPEDAGMASPTPEGALVESSMIDFPSAILQEGSPESVVAAYTNDLKKLCRQPGLGRDSEKPRFG